MKRIVAVALMLIALSIGGCGSMGGSVVASMDGHTITGRPEGLSSASLLNTGQATTLTMNGQTFHITVATVAWGASQSVALPDGWRNLELVAKSGVIAVIVDGKKLAEARPET